MSKNIRIFIVCALVFVLGVGAFFAFKMVGVEKQKDVVIIQTSTGQSHKFKVELALTPEKQAKGLMNRMEMDQDVGMLFVFAPDSEISFYMKNTFIPLDMIFIKTDGTIHRIHENAIPHDLTSIPSNGPILAVLEINGGLSSKLGIAAGDRVLNSVFKE